jgi:hypothetical protein
MRRPFQQHLSPLHTFQPFSPFSPFSPSQCPPVVQDRDHPLSAGPPSPCVNLPTARRHKCTTPPRAIHARNPATPTDPFHPCPPLHPFAPCYPSNSSAPALRPPNPDPTPRLHLRPQTQLTGLKPRPARPHPLNTENSELKTPPDLQTFRTLRTLPPLVPAAHTSRRDSPTSASMR